eukprot:1443539-Rhodomonas_salina.1
MKASGFYFPTTHTLYFQGARFPESEAHCAPPQFLPVLSCRLAQPHFQYKLYQECASTLGTGSSTLTPTRRRGRSALRVQGGAEDYHVTTHVTSVLPFLASKTTRRLLAMPCVLWQSLSRDSRATPLQAHHGLAPNFEPFNHSLQTDAVQSRRRSFFKRLVRVFLRAVLLSARRCKDPAVNPALQPRGASASSFGLSQARTPGSDSRFGLRIRTWSAGS